MGLGEGLMETTLSRGRIYLSPSFDFCTLGIPFSEFGEVGALGIPFGLHLATFGFNLSTLGLHLVTLGLHLGTLGLHLATLGLHLGTLGLHVGTIGLHLSTCGLHFGHVGGVLGSRLQKNSKNPVF